MTHTYRNTYIHEVYTIQPLTHYNPHDSTKQHLDPTTHNTMWSPWVSILDYAHTQAQTWLPNLKGQRSSSKSLSHGHFWSLKAYRIWVQILKRSVQAFIFSQSLRAFKGFNPSLEVWDPSLAPSLDLAFNTQIFLKTYILTLFHLSTHKIYNWI